MSKAMWCDLGRHVYPDGQPGSTQIGFTQQVKNQWGGYQPQQVLQDVCGACAADSGVKFKKDDMPEEEALQRAKEDRKNSGFVDRVAKALPDSDPELRKEYTKFLEERAGVSDSDTTG